MNIITGMHRSGTSLIAKLLYEAGVDMGEPETFFKPDKWNSDGYYEQTEVFELNKKILHGLWGKLNYLFLPSEKTINNRSKKYVKSIQIIADKYINKTVKDPRFCMTLNAWKNQNIAINKIIFCVREPIQTAESLKKRNKIFTKLGLYLWFEHNKRLLEYTRNIPTWFVFYNNILNESTFLAEAKGMFSFLGYELTNKQLIELQKKCVNPKLNNNSDICDSYPKKIKDLLELIKNKHAKQIQS